AIPDLAGLHVYNAEKTGNSLVSPAGAGADDDDLLAALIDPPAAAPPNSPGRPHEAIDFALAEQVDQVLAMADGPVLRDHDEGIATSRASVVVAKNVEAHETQAGGGDQNRAR